MHSGGRETCSVGLALWALLALGFTDTNVAIAQPDWSQSARVPGVSQPANDAPPRALGVPADCNMNGIDDELDIAAGTSVDCNSNGLPDECDLVPSGIAAQIAKLTAADAAADDNFGFSVALSGDTAVVGAFLDDDGGTNSGSAYVFVRSGGVWTQQAKLTAADAAASDFFGSSVALSGDTAVVGAQYDNDGGAASGSAYVFVRSGGVWTQQAKLTAADAAAGDRFGWSVALSGDTAVVGAIFDDDGGANSGSAYVFVRSGGVWTQQAKLTAADAAANDEFGWSVALSGDTAVVGAHADDDGGTNSGSAYVFNLGLLPDSLDFNSNGIPDECEIDCNLNGVSDILDIAVGTSEDCNFNGQPDECEPDTDTDGLIDDCDNCPDDANLDQSDFDADSAGDACDDDIDGDGVPNETDVCDFTPPGAIIEPDGGILGDLDGDCDVDLVDFAIMQERFTGPGG